MKQIKIPARLAIALLCLGLAGCETQKTAESLGSGYTEVTHTIHANGEDEDLSRTSFEYRGSDGKTIHIWPSLYGVKGVVKGDLAIFVGDVSYMEAGIRGTWPRLFAVQSPALPLDITDEVLWRWSKTAGKDFRQAFNKLSLVTPVENNDGLELQLDFNSEGNKLPDKAVLQLDWDEVSEIMRTVKAKGVELKDLEWHTPFIEEKL